MSKTYFILIIIGFFSQPIWGNIETDSLLALQQHQRGVAAFIKGDYGNAINAFQIALTKRETFLEKGHLDLIKGNHNIGTSYYEMQNYEPAIQYLQEAISINLSRIEPIESRLANSYQILGKVYFKAGDIEIGEEYLLSTLDIYQKVYKDRPWRIAELHLDFCVFFINQFQSHKIINHAQDALKIYNSFSKKEYEDYKGMSNAYTNLGIGYELQDQLDKSITAYQQALIINQKFPKKRQAHIAKIYNNLSIIYKKKQDFEQALAYSNQAIDINKQLQLPLYLARNIHNKGEIYAEQQDYKKALAEQQKALSQVILGFEPIDYYSNPIIKDAIIIDKVNVLTYLRAKAKAFQGLATQSDATKNYQAAIENYQILLELADQLRNDIQSDASKSFLAGNTKDMMDEAIATALQLHQLTQEQKWLEQAFAFAERSKASVLLEAVNRQQLRVETTGFTPIIQREQDIQRSIAAIEQEIFYAQNEGRMDTIAPLRLQLLQDRERLNDIRDSISQRQENTINDFQLASIQQQLLNDNATTLIEFFVGKQHIYRFLLTSSSIEVATIPLDFDLTNWITTLRKGIYEGHISNESLTAEQRDSLNKNYATYASLLYKKLIPTSTAQRLLIIPDGILGFIPFDALLSEEVLDNYADFTNYQFLARQKHISYAYSAALLQYAQRTSKNTDNQQLIAFVPTYTYPESNAVTSQRSVLLPLKFSLQEAQTIVDLWTTGTLITDATKSDFWDKADQASFLHFSAHAAVNSENPDYSYIAFSQPTSALDEKELLYINDLYASSLQAEMVVLSACETGIGNIDKGEGVLSLARAFTYAGAKSIITSLWQVNDNKTTRLMTRFYELLTEGHAKDEALFLAKHEFIEEGIDIHPYYWAGFVPIGNMGMVVGKRPIWLFVSLGMLFLIILLGVVRVCLRRFKAQ